MIEHLTGTVLHRQPHSLIIDVNGVGYGVEMPLSALCEAPAPGQKISVWIDTYVREDVIRLFGFLSFEDRQAFIMLRSVNGIGPRIALAVLSTLDAYTLRQTVIQGKTSMLESVPGIGRRTAEKMILELKPKMEKLSFAAPAITANTGNQSKRAGGMQGEFDFDLPSDRNRTLQQQIFADVRSALENLGYKEKDVLPVLSTLEESYTTDTESCDFQVLLKTALKSIRAGM